LFYVSAVLFLVLIGVVWWARPALKAAGGKGGAAGAGAH
jgi:DHA2 family multidrug resistance protein